MIAIIDYGMGNLGSIKNMVKKLKFDAIITSSKEDILNASKLILPGVGSFDNAMANIKKLDLFEIINCEVLEKKKPILGICLGMQLLTKGSEEGSLNGFGFIDAKVKKINSSNLRVPHMGWNNVYKNKKSIFFNEFEEYRYYFVHSYIVECNNPSDVLTTTNYGNRFVSTFLKDNIIGAQYHPEKSHKFGKSFFNTFLKEFNA